MYMSTANSPVALTSQLQGTFRIYGVDLLFGYQDTAGGRFDTIAFSPRYT